MTRTLALLALAVPLAGPAAAQPVPDPRYGRAPFLEPSGLGYLHVAAEVDPKRLAGDPMTAWAEAGPTLSPGRDALLAEVEELLDPVRARDDVVRATVYEAILIPPGSREAGGVAGPERARNDVAVLIETADEEAAQALAGDPAMAALLDAVEAAATSTHLTVAGNLRRVADVDKDRPGVFLFNYFAGDPGRRDALVDTWEYTAGWFLTETGLDNSTLLGPLDGTASDYVVINHARWDGMEPVMAGLRKPEFGSYVMANVAAMGAAAMPVLYRLHAR